MSGVQVVVLPDGCLVDAEYLSLSADQVDEIDNGCGGKGVPDLVPDCIIGADVSPACRYHDVEYWLGKDFHGANRRFLHNLLACCACDCAVTYMARRKVCFAYFETVCVAGRPFFGRGA